MDLPQPLTNNIKTGRKVEEKGQCSVTGHTISLPYAHLLPSQIYIVFIKNKIDVFLKLADPKTLIISLKLVFC